MCNIENGRFAPTLIFSVLMSIGPQPSIFLAIFGFGAYPPSDLDSAIPVSSETIVSASAESGLMVSTAPVVTAEIFKKSLLSI